MEIVKTQLIAADQINHDANAQAYSQANNMDKRIPALPKDVPPGYFYRDGMHRHKISQPATGMVPVLHLSDNQCVRQGLPLRSVRFQYIDCPQFLNPVSSCLFSEKEEKKTQWLIIYYFHFQMFTNVKGIRLINGPTMGCQQVVTTINKLFMKNTAKVEVLVSPDYSSENHNHRELVRWMVDVLQPLVLKKQLASRKIVLKSLAEIPPIYLS
jgi:hypothetical protein